jgi:hypothetical protein
MGFKFGNKVSVRQPHHIFVEVFVTPKRKTNTATRIFALFDVSLKLFERQIIFLLKHHLLVPVSFEKVIPMKQKNTEVLLHVHVMQPMNVYPTSEQNAKKGYLV